MSKRKTPKRGASGRFKKDGRKNKRTRRRNPSTSVARSSNPTRKSNPARRSSNGPRRSSNPTRRSNPARRSSNPTPNPSRRRRRRRNPDLGPVGKLLIAGLVGVGALYGVTMGANYAANRGADPKLVAAGIAAVSGGVGYLLRNASPPASLAVAGVGIGIGGTMLIGALTGPEKQQQQQGPQFNQSAFQGGGQLSGLHARSLRAVEQVVGAYGYPEVDSVPYESSDSLGLYS